MYLILAGQKRILRRASVGKHWGRHHLDFYGEIILKMIVKTWNVSVDDMRDLRF